MLSVNILSVIIVSAIVMNAVMLSVTFAVGRYSECCNFGCYC